MTELRDSDILTDKTKEAEYVQKRADEAEAAARTAEEAKKIAAQEQEFLRPYNTMREYTNAMAALEEYLTYATIKMERMRGAGVPDTSEYHDIRDEITRRYEKFQAISQRMVDLAEDSAAQGGDIRKMARVLIQVDRREELENAYRKIVDAAEKYGRRETDYTLEARAMPLELYDDEVRKLLYLAAELEENVQSFSTQGMLDKLRPTIRKEMDAILAKLKELDKSTAAKDRSKERTSLMEMLATIDEKLGDAQTATPVFGPAVEPRASLVVAPEGPDDFKSSAERYDEGVRKLFDDAAKLEEDVVTCIEFNSLEANLPSLRSDLAGILDKLKELGKQKTDDTPSRERDALIELLGKIDERLDEPSKATPTSSLLGRSRADYRAVKAQYAAVQHTLTEDQRREMRKSIFSMSDAVRHAEDEAWQGMFAAQFAVSLPAEPPLQTAIRVAVAHATEHAPALATAVLASLPRATPMHTAKPHGFFATLASVFKGK